MMSIVKYDNLFLFDADDIRLTDLVELVIKESINFD